MSVEPSPPLLIHPSEWSRMREVIKEMGGEVYDEAPEPKPPAIGDLNPDGISDHDQANHKGHRVRRVGQGSNFKCLDCRLSWQMKRNTAIARARLLR